MWEYVRLRNSQNGRQLITWIPIQVLYFDAHFENYATACTLILSLGNLCKHWHPGLSYSRETQSTTKPLANLKLCSTLWSPNRPTLHPLVPNRPTLHPLVPNRPTLYPLVPKSTYSSPFGPQIDLLFTLRSPNRPTLSSSFSRLISIHVFFKN